MKKEKRFYQNVKDNKEKLLKKYSSIRNEPEKVKTLIEPNYKSHFRDYYKSQHPAFITGEDKENYHFHRTTSSEFDGHHKNLMLYPNPDKNKTTPMCIVKRKEVDNKKRFSKKKKPWKIK